jgi:glycosyltransferase involved in cell wall biosynthesis
MTPHATVVITTRNRGTELLRAIQSVLDQQAPVDVLVIDDGSTDGTTDTLRNAFPSVRVERSEKSLGLIVQRNRAAQLVTTPIIISIDDDAILPSPGILQQTLADFNHPRIGAVAMPHIDVKYGPHIYHQAPDTSGVYVVNTYRGTAHALRRDLFLKLGGYHGYLFHQHEEGDYCIRLLNAGFFVRAGRATPLHHEASPKRNHTRIYTYSARNNILFAWYNVPAPELLLRLLIIPFSNLLYGLKIGYPWTTLKGLARGFCAITHEFSQRQPVSRRTYRLYRWLIRHGPMKMENIEPRLGPPANVPLPRNGSGAGVRP